MINAVIIDDERDAIDTLSMMIKEYCPNVSISGTADSVIDAIKLIQNEKPQLVFLDVEMPHGTGFDVLESIPDKSFQVIFTTAYDHYALKAIKFSALDYLMKPMDIDDLIGAVDKAHDRITFNNGKNNNLLLKNVQDPDLNKIAFPVSNGFKFLELSEIVYIKSDGAYSNVITQSGDNLMVSKNLKVYDDLLGESGFFRLHNSYLINLDHVQEFIRNDGGWVLMSNGEKVPIARSKKNILLEKLNI